MGAALATPKLSAVMSLVFVCLESVSGQLKSMETFSFENPPGRESKTRVREIAELQDTVARVCASLRSFARYAPAEIVREVAASGRETILSAGRREVTALFCDLRGFTNVAEKLAPEEVVTILNDHFDTLSGLIARHGGYVVDFLGDGLFAVFGAPEASVDHAARAVACAIEMQLAREAHNRDTSPGAGRPSRWALASTPDSPSSATWAPTCGSSMGW